MIDYAFTSYTARDIYGGALQRGTPGSAGLDLRAVTITQVGAIATVGFGVAVDVRPGRVGILTVRSGFATDTGLNLVNAPGKIDSDYRGEVMAKFRGHVPASYLGARIAQLVVVDCDMDEPRLLDSLPETARGNGGFGSTGQ